MGCQVSCANSGRPSEQGSYNGTPTADGQEDSETGERNLDDVQLRRLQFMRSASSSTSSLNSSALKLGSSRRKKKGKKRPFAQLNGALPSSTFDGGEISTSILGDLPKIIEVNEALEKLAKEDSVVEQQILGRGGTPGIPAPPLSPSANKATTVGAMSRFRGRKSRNDESETSQTEDMPASTQPTHRRQHSNENFFQRLQSGALGGHRRQGSVDVNLAKSDLQPSTDKAVLVNSNSGSGASLNQGQSGVLTVIPPSSAGSTSGGGGGQHRRQNSESKMFARIVRVSSLAAMTTSISSPEPSESSNVSTAPPTCTTKTFRSFLERENREAPSVEDLEMWRSRVLGVSADERWTISQMHDFLFSAANQAKDDKFLAQPLDMTRPLTEYFVSTSHNTYLFGGQWVTTGGKVDLQMYSRALKQGCRCVEIDVYDGPDGDPIVTHVSSAWSGGSVTFLEVCALIAKEAFRESRAPLILNLENNMGKQSKRAAEILMGSFGSRIVRTDDSEFGWTGNVTRQTCPTPAELAGRVLCRSKPREACEEYQSLIYLRNSPWRFTNQDEILRRKFYQTSSLSESKVKGALKKLPGDIMSYELNRAFINRVYPRASAYASQNYSPLPYWLLGFQLVALNFQTDGIDMDLNHCMFERNASQGWVLKPPLLRRSMAKIITRMNGGVRHQSTRGISISSSTKFPKPLLLQSSNGEPSPHSAGLPPRNFFTQSSKLLAGIVSSKETPSAPPATSAQPANGGAAAAAQPVNTTGPLLHHPTRMSDLAQQQLQASNGMSASPTATAATVSQGLRRTEHSKSFMGVVEEALTNQNEEDEEDMNEDEEELPPPPQMTSGNPFPPPSGARNLATVSENGPVTLTGLKRPQSALARTLSSQSNEPLTDSSEVPVKTVTDLDLELPAASTENPAESTAYKTSATDTEEERKRRARARRRSTGSMLKSSPDVGLGEQPPVTRKGSLENMGSARDLLVRSPSSSILPSTDMFGSVEDESALEDKVAMTSALFQFISVRCNLSRERSPVATGVGAAASGAPLPHAPSSASKKASDSVSSSANGPRESSTNSALGGRGGQNDLRQHNSSSAHQSYHSVADDVTDEEHFIEVLVDGHQQLDRVEKRTMGTVVLRGTQPGEFKDREEIATMFKDSESALVTVRLIDAWDGGNAREVVASRTFFAHCLLPGTRDLILLGEGSNAGYPVPYTVRCRISTLYSVFSKATGRFELEERVELPVLSCPSKLTMVHCVVVACRAETNKLKLGLLDPFVNVQVIGVPSDCRETRTPRVSRCSNSNSRSVLPFGPKVSTGGGGTTAAGGPQPGSASKASNLVIGTLVGADSPASSASAMGSSGEVMPTFVGGGSLNECTWMFPLVMTFAWSEFAFLRITLRSNVNVDTETGAVLNSMGGSSTRRRGSLSFLSGGNPHPSGVGPGAPMSGSTPSHAHGGSTLSYENGFVLGKTMLWADAIRPGYRSLPLYSEKNPDTHVATLLCHFTLFNAREQTFGPNLEEVPLIKVPEPPPTV